MTKKQKFYSDVLFGMIHQEEIFKKNNIKIQKNRQDILDKTKKYFAEQFINCGGKL